MPPPSPSQRTFTTSTTAANTAPPPTMDNKWDRTKWDRPPGLSIRRRRRLAKTLTTALLNFPLLCQTRLISGIVSDPHGDPLAGAQPDHAGGKSRPHQTDAAGRFELDTDAPAVVIRNPGFRSAFVPTRGAVDLRITLRKLQPPVFPLCSIAPAEPQQGIFQFPTVPGIRA